MRKNLELFLDLNEIENVNDYYVIADILEQNTQLTVHSYYYKGFIFKNYSDLLNGKISLEDFMTAGDIYSEQKIYENTDKLESLFEIHTLLTENIQNFQNSVIVVNNNAVHYFKHHYLDKYNQLLQLLKENNSYLVSL